MKLFIPLFFLILLVSSCGEKKLSEILIGEWKVKEVKLPEKNLPPSLIDDFKKEMLSSVYIFKDKGVFELRSALIPDGTSGIWRAKDDAGEIYIEYKAGSNTAKSTYKIEVVNENKIIFRQSFGADLGEMEAVLEK